MNSCSNKWHSAWRDPLEHTSLKKSEAPVVFEVLSFTVIFDKIVERKG